MIYVRYVYKENVEEDLLFCRPLKDILEGKTYNEKLTNFLKIKGLRMENRCEVCTDGAKAMTGKNIGLKSFFQAANYDHITFTHCRIHREVSQQKN